MDAYLSEEEQWEVVKKWWREYGVMILLGILLAFAAGFGWRYWKRHQTAVASEASLAYQHILVSFTDQKILNFKKQAHTLMEQYPSTPYGTFSAWMLAKQAVDENKLPKALSSLQWAMDHTRNTAFKQISRLRVARVLLAMKKPERALSLLNTIDNKVYLPLIDEVRGDIYLAMGRKHEARAAYQVALLASTAMQLHRPLLEMKLSQLPAGS